MNQSKTRSRLLVVLYKKYKIIYLRSVSMALALNDFLEWQVQPPAWMNLAWFTQQLDAISADSGEAHVIESVDLRPTKHEFHFTSMVFRAKIKYRKTSTPSEGHSCEWIIKALLEDRFGRFDEALLSESTVFETEIGLYTKVVPKMEEIFERANCNVKFSPSCLHHSLQPKKFLILQDLKCEGFESSPLKSFSYETTSLIYEKLAQFHAASYKISRDDSSFLTPYRDGYLRLPVVRPMDFVTDLKSFKVTVSVGSSERLRRFLPQVSRLCEHLLTKSIESFTEYSSDRQENSVYVLCHGSMLAGHVLVHARDVALIDFSMSYVGPAALDLLYMKYMLCSSEVRKQHADDFIAKYHNRFVETLARLGCEGAVPTLDDLKRDLKRHKYWEMFVAFVLYRHDDYQKYDDDLADILEGFEADGYFDD